MNRIPAGLLLAAAASLAAAAVFGVTLQRALVVEEMAPSQDDAAAVVDVAPDSAAKPLTTEALMLAVDHDPFQPDRKRSGFRYRLPGDEPPPPPPAPPPPPPPPPFRLIGTGLSGQRAVAVIEIENTARLVEVGESLLGYTLESLTPEQAVMVGSVHTLRLPLTVSIAAAGGAGGRGNTARPQQPQQGRTAPVPFEIERRLPNAPNTPAGRGGGPGGADQLRELVERIRREGGSVTPQMLEMIQRMQQEGRAVEVQTDGGRVMIRTRPDTMLTPAPHAPQLR